MPVHRSLQHEVNRLTEQLLEQTLSAEGAARLEQLLRSSQSARRQYIDRLTLHGLLHWDGAQCGESLEDLDHPLEAGALVCALPEFQEQEAASQDNGGEIPAAVPENGQLLRGADVAARPSVAGRFEKFRTHSALLTTVAASALLLFGGGLLAGFLLNSTAEQPVAEQPAAEHPRTGNQTEVAASESERSRGVPSLASLSAARESDDQPAVSPRAVAPLNPMVTNRPQPQVVSPRMPVTAPRHIAQAVEEEIPAAGSSDEAIVAFIDGQLQASWHDSGIEPSAAAPRAEWVRRAWLDLAGHIPAVEDMEQSLSSNNPGWRSQLIDELLDSPEFVQHLSTTWTNLLVGRSAERDTEREALSRFLRQQFAANQPWNTIVEEIVAAEGSLDQNPAAGYLLAHLNNEAVPATAITARLFLGTQVQCTQCHDHPFNDATQNQFWELNGFFQQTAAVPARQLNAEAPEGVMALVSREGGGPIYYETRRGLMRAAFPRFEGTSVSPDAGINRRQELARLMTSGSKPQLAAAFVNRMWSHFFGYGFTRPVDDMGPHNPPTHPLLLDRLAREFVASGYDVRRLIRWITASDAYSRTSLLTEANELDNPDTGMLPLFSRVYVRPLTAEQLYDSLLVATRGERAVETPQSSTGERRDEWLRQFVYAYETEENDEATAFEGTISQALMLMNGELVEDALSNRSGTWLHQIAAAPLSENVKIRRIWLAALSREPTEAEMNAARGLLRRTAPRSLRGEARQQAMVGGLQDLFWACLNSSEFMLVH